MTQAEIRDVASKSNEEIIEFIIKNPQEEEPLLYFMKNKVEFKNKFFGVSSLLKDSKQNTKGIGALTAEIVQNISKNGYQEIDVDLLKDNPYQPRIEIKQDSLMELANDIKRDGLQSPIKVSPNNDGTYTIVYGHRRTEAHRLLGMDKIKCFVEQIDDPLILRRLALNENTKREDLSILELAISYKEYLLLGIYSTQKELSEDLGVRESKLAEILSVLKLDDRIIDDLKKNKTIKDTTALAALNKLDADKQFEVYCLFRDGEIDREGISKYKEKGVVKNNSQCEFGFKNKKFNLTYQVEIKDKNKAKEFKSYVNDRVAALVKELKEEESRLSSK